VHRHETKNGSGGRRQRIVGEGYMWPSEGREKPIVDETGTRVIGYKLELSYGFKESPRVRTEANQTGMVHDRVPPRHCRCRSGALHGVRVSPEECDDIRRP
jgi:hypothetical protein